MGNGRAGTFDVSYILRASAHALSTTLVHMVRDADKLVLCSIFASSLSQLILFTSDVSHIVTATGAACPPVVNTQKRKNVSSQANRREMR